MLGRHTAEERSFDEALARLRDRGEADFSRVEAVVREAMSAVKTRGDEAVRELVRRFESREPATPMFRAGANYGGKEALTKLDKEERAALELAAERIATFHRHERDAISKSFRYEDGGVTLGLRVRPLARVGVYAPGGKARYPSSVLMSAIPARVAGVSEIVLATPLSGGEADVGVLAAAHLAGVSAVVDAGGAQAIAALAYGTATIPRVDKIVGPGNAYVACAKRLAYGAVAIDSIAGPSEILVVADRSADPVHVAADLLSQAEHDEDAYPLLICQTNEQADAIDRELARQLETLPRKAIAHASLTKNGHAFVVSSREGMIEASNAIAPEHLSLQVEDPEGFLDLVPNAGAAFLGRLTPEAAGDYVAGPSHVLPTGGAVRFGSPLGVHDFIARTSVLRYSAEALARDERTITVLARMEGLEAHARAVSLRTTRADADGGSREAE